MAQLQTHKDTRLSIQTYRRNKVSTDRRCSQETYNSGGAAEFHSSDGVICPQDNSKSCTTQIWTLWKSGKKKAVVEKKAIRSPVYSLLEAMWGTEQVWEKVLRSDETKTELFD